VEARDLQANLHRRKCFIPIEAKDLSTTRVILSVAKDLTATRFILSEAKDLPQDEALPSGS